MRMKIKSGRMLARTIGVALSAVLLFTSPVTQAGEKGAERGEHWSAWKALSSGYVARRRQPPKLDQNPAERRLESVQERLPNLLRQKKRLLAKQTKNGRLSARQQKGLAKLDQRIAGQVPSLGTLALAVEGVVAVDALWLRTLAEGLYGVSITDLAAGLGEDADTVRGNATRGELSLTNADDPISWYFDSAADMILFAGETYDTFYADQNAYRFRLGLDKAQPMQVADGAPTDAFGNETPFRDTLNFEEEPDLHYSTGTVASEPDADYWFWDYLYGGYKDLIEVPLNIPNPASDGTARLWVTLRGWTDLESGDEHQVTAKLNGVPVGSAVTWDGFDEAVLTTDFNQSLLNADGNNTLSLHNRYAAGTHPGQWLNQIEIDYLRQPVANAGKLWMHAVTAGTQTVTGFTSNGIRVIESPDGTPVMREDVRIDPDGSGGWSVTFEAAGGADYLVAGRSALATPTLAPDFPSNLKTNSNRADYLIIASRDFTGTAKALADYRRSRFSDIKIAWLDEIYDEFNAGREDPFTIGRFMRHVTGTWQLAPTNVALIGKGSLDEKNRMGYGDSFLPVLMTSNPWALAASDSRLLGFEDGAPFAIGRLPITNDAEGMAYVDKLIAHESATPGDERLQAVLVADNPDGGGDFHTNSNHLANRLLNTPGFKPVTTLYHPQDAVRSRLIQSDTWNTDYVSYDGHGSTAQVGNGKENFIKAADAGALANTAYPVFTALTCASGDDSLPGTRSLAGALVLNPTGGAIAAMAPTGLSLDGDAQTLGNAFADSLFGSNNTIGHAVLDAKTQTNGGISAFMPRMYSVVGEPGVHAR